MWHKSAATPREVRARLGPATAHGMGELVAKVGYSRRHGGAPQHRKAWESQQQKVQASAKERGIRCGDAEVGVGETWTGQPRHTVWATLEAKV